MKRKTVTLAFVFMMISALAYGPDDYEMILKTGSNDDRVELGKLFYGVCGRVETLPPDYIKAVKLFYAAAVQHHPNAQYWLSKMYSEGHGVRKRPDKAYVWAFSASERGDADAQNLLGVYFTEGIGTEADLEKAAQYFVRSARQGNAKGQYNLAVCYETGAGLEQDAKKAVDWYKRAARQDLPIAQYNLGTCYEYGIGVQVDYNSAYSWYNSAANLGNSYAQTALGRLYESAKGVQEDPIIAANWYRAASDQGNIAGILKLAEFYDRGYGVPRSPSNAARLYAKAAENGDAEAQLRYAISLESSADGSADIENAKKWYEMSAVQGNENAASRLKIIALDSDEVKSRAENAAKTEFVFKGLYPGMPVEDAAYTLEQILQKDKQNGKLILFISKDKNGNRKVSHENLVEITGDSSGKVTNIFIDNSIADILFETQMISNEKFISFFSNKYNLSDTTRSETTAFITADGRRAGSQKQIIYKHESGSEIVFYGSYIISRLKGAQDPVKAGLCKPAGSFAVRRAAEK
jgi:TPR repeat protein